MSKRSTLLLATALFFGLAIVPAGARADMLTTADPNNTLNLGGSGTVGILFDLTATNSLEVTSIDTWSGAAAGTAVTFEVWVRSGSYEGFYSNQAGWTLQDTINTTSAGNWSSGTLSGSATTISLANTIDIAAGETVGVQVLATVGSLSYTGQSGTTPQTTFGNSDLALVSDRLWILPWSGMTFSPRTFAGTIEYGLTTSPGVHAPAPGAALLAIVGLGMVALVSRRYL